MERIYNAFLSLSGLPLVVVDSVAHHSPGNSGVDTKTEAVYELAKDINNKVETYVIRSDDKQTCTADDGADRAHKRELLLTVLGYHLTCERCEENDRDHSEELNDTRDLGVLEVDLEGYRNCGSRALHTDKHTHSGDGCTDCGTVLDKVCKSLEYVELRLIIVELCVGINADLGVLDHKLEADKSDNAHYESGNEYHISVKRLVLVVDQERKNYHRKHISYHRTDRTPSRERCAVCGIVGNKREKRAVGYVCDGIESIPDYVSCDEDYELSPYGSAREGQEAASSADDKSDRAYEDVLQKLISSLVSVLISVDDRADKRVVDSVPYLNDDEQERVPRAHTHYLSPEESHGSLERKAHITTKVAGCISNTVSYAKLAVTVGIKFLFFFHC